MGREKFWTRDDEAARLEDAADFRLTWTEDWSCLAAHWRGAWSNKERADSTSRPTADPNMAPAKS